MNPCKNDLVIVFHEGTYKRARIDEVIVYNRVADCFMIDYGYTIEVRTRAALFLKSDL
jgi:hypothetical protein